PAANPRRSDRVAAGRTVGRRCGHPVAVRGLLAAGLWRGAGNPGPGPAAARPEALRPAPLHHVVAVPRPGPSADRPDPRRTGEPAPGPAAAPRCQAGRFEAAQAGLAERCAPEVAAGPEKVGLAPDFGPVGVYWARGG